MDFKYRIDARNRSDSTIPIGMSRTWFYNISEQETRPERGDVLPGYDREPGALTGLQSPIVTHVAEAKDKNKALKGIFVTAIQPFSLDGAEHATGYMEVRGSLKGHINRVKKTKMIYGLSDGTDTPVAVPVIGSTRTINSETYYVQDIDEDIDTIPGLTFLRIRFHLLETYA